MPNQICERESGDFENGQHYRCARCDESWNRDFFWPTQCVITQDRRPQINTSPLPARENLESALSTFKERNEIYSNNYQSMGRAIMAIFPDGVPKVETEEDANRLNIFINCLGKLQRYAFAFHKGGHKDSAHDLIVYAAMLEEMTK